jgi:hypothetical protein
MVETPRGFWEEFDKDWPHVGVLQPHGKRPYFGAIGSLDGEGKWSHFSPLPRKMNDSDWTKFKCETYTCRNISWEYAPGGRRHPIGEEELRLKFMKIKFIKGNSLDGRFGSCMCCWKTGIRKFNDAEVTPYPSNCAIDDPRLPRLGMCGCTICNSCVLALERRLGDRTEYPCPYCGNSGCFTKEIKVWPISHEVFMKHFSRLRELAGE